MREVFTSYDKWLYGLYVFHVMCNSITSFEYFIHSLLPVQYPLYHPFLHVGLKLGQSSSLVHSMKKCLETYEKLVYGKILIHKLTGIHNFCIVYVGNEHTTCFPWSHFSSTISTITRIRIRARRGLCNITISVKASTSESKRQIFARACRIIWTAARIIYETNILFERIVQKRDTYIYEC